MLADLEGEGRRVRTVAVPIWISRRSTPGPLPQGSGYGNDSVQNGPFGYLGGQPVSKRRRTEVLPIPSCLAEGDSLGSCLGDAGFHAFPQNLALELSEDSQHAGRCATCWGSHVEDFGKRDKADAQLRELLQGK